MKKKKRRRKKENPRNSRNINSIAVFGLHVWIRLFQAIIAFFKINKYIKAL